MTGNGPKRAKSARGRSQPFQRSSDGRWCLSEPHGKHPVTGRTVYKSFYGSSRAEVVRKAREWREESAGRPLRVGGGHTVQSWCVSWLESRVIADRAPSTVSNYESLLRVNVYPVIGEVPLAELAPTHIQWLYRKLTTTPRKTASTGETLSASTIRTIHRILVAAMERAVPEHLAYNVVKKVDPPRAQARSVLPLTGDERGAVLASFDQDPNAALWYILMLNSPRVGQAIGITRDDLHLEEGYIDLRADGAIKRRVWAHGCAESRAGSTVAPAHPPGKCPKRVANALLGRPKTEQSARRLYLADVVIAKLRERLQLQDKHRAAAPKRWKANEVRRGDGSVVDLVFTDIWGKHLTSYVVYDQFKRLCVRAGVEPTRVHALRHTSASLAHEVGADSRARKDLLGVGESNMVDHYTHPAESTLRDLAQKMADKVDEERRASRRKSPNESG